MADYAIKNTRTKSVKIGYSVTPEDRLKTLQTGNEDELEMVAFFPHGDLQFEGRLHEILDGYNERIRGEWFRGPVTDCMAAVINMMGTDLGSQALRTLLRQLTEVTEDGRGELAALLCSRPDERAEPTWGERITFLLSDGAC